MKRLSYALAVILVAAFCVLVSSCPNRSNNASTEASPKPSRPPITADQAVEITKKTISSEVGDLEMLDFQVLENPDSWTVSFSLKEQYKHWHGGDGGVEVDKRTGEVLRVYIGK